MKMRIPNANWGSRLLLTTAALLGAAVTAPAPPVPLVMSVQNTSYTAGTSNDTLEVTLTNNGTSPITIGGFSFGISVGTTNLSFTSGNISTATAPYIFDGLGLFGPNITVSPPNLPGQALNAEDIFSIPGSGATIGSGVTVGLGKVLFNIDPMTPTSMIPVTLSSTVSSVSDVSGNSIPFGLSSGNVSVTGLTAPSLSNPNFEIGPFFADGTITGWVVGGNGGSAHVGDNAEGGTSGSHSAAFSSGGNSQGDTLSQDFPTTSGINYALDFDAGVFGKRSGAPLQLHVEVVGGMGNLVDQMIIPPDASTFDAGSVTFQHYHFPFTADGSMATLRFTNIGLGNGSADELVDTVAINLVPQGSPTPAPTLQNPNFDIGPFFADGTVTGWVVGGNGRVADNEEGSTSGSHSAALSSGKDSQGDTLSQGFATVAGQNYALAFDAGIFGQRSGAALQLRVELLGNGTLLNTVITPPDAFTFNAGAVQFSHYIFPFMANSTATTVRFTSVGLGNSAADQVIDTVSINPSPVPTPTPTPTPTPGPSFANGDFESGPFFTDGTVTGWIVGGNGHVADNTEGATSGAHSAALSSGGNSQGDTLSQSFSTVSGQMYAVDFDAGIFGKRSGAPLQIQVNVIGNGNISTQTITPSDAMTFNAGSVIFTHYHIVFQANSATTTLRFTSVGLGNGSADQIIDSVSVSPVP